VVVFAKPLAQECKGMQFGLLDTVELFNGFINAAMVAANPLCEFLEAL